VFECGDAAPLPAGDDFSFEFRNTVLDRCPVWDYSRIANERRNPMSLKDDLEKECFFIAPIGADGSEARKRSDGVLKFIVGRAAEELGLVAVRADRIAEPGQITLQVIEHVLGARAAVVDLTGLNPNVFYELAVRHAAKMPVALIAEVGCDLPFDIAQMRTIFFDHTDLDSADKCREAIVSHLREALVNGSVDSPIATTLDVNALQAGSAVERNVAELVTAVESISRLQRSTMGLVETIAESSRPSPDALDDLHFRYSDLRAAVEANAPQPVLKELSDKLAPVVRYLVRDTRLGARRRRPFIPRQVEEDVDDLAKPADT
jgi:hypothetical protein